MAMNRTTNLKQLIAWWIEQLSDVFVQRSSRRSWRTLLYRTSIGFDVFKRTGRSIERIGTLTQDQDTAQSSRVKERIVRQAAKQPRSTLLRLSGDDVLLRTIQIPARATDVIVPVLRHQLNRALPWPDDQTLFGYRAMGPGSSRPDEINVRIAATRRSVLDCALSNAQQFGLAPYAVDFAERPEDPEGIEIMSLGPDPRIRIQSRIRWLLGSAAAASVLLCCLGLFLTFHRQAESQDLANQIQATKALMASFSEEKDKNARHWRQVQKLIELKNRDPAVVVLLEALSRAFPDNAYLTELEIQGREIRMVGNSRDAAALVPILEGTSHFKNAQFAAASTRIEDENLTRFSISAQTYGKNDLDE